MSQIASFYLLKDGQRQELSNGDCSGVVYMAIWDWWHYLLQYLSPYFVLAVFLAQSQ